MLIIDKGLGRVISPFPVYHILVLIGARMKSQTSPEENLSLLINFSVELIKGLPFFPTASNQNLVRNVLRVRLIHEICFFGGARAEVYVATLRANTWHS